MRKVSITTSTRDQQRGIDQRRNQLLAKADGQALKGNIAAKHFLEVAALLTRQQRGGVDLGKDGLGLEGFRQQFAAAHAVAHVLQYGTEEEIALALNEEFQRLDDGQAGMNQGNELLVEDDELLLLDLATPGQADFALIAGLST